MSMAVSVIVRMVMSRFMPMKVRMAVVVYVHLNIVRGFPGSAAYGAAVSGKYDNTIPRIR
jgi:hypothetical protein